MFLKRDLESGLRRTGQICRGREGEVKGNPRFLPWATERGRPQHTIIRTTCSGSPSPSINSFVTLGKLLKFHVLLFPHLYNKNNRIYVKGFCEELRESS